MRKSLVSLLALTMVLVAASGCTSPAKSTTTPAGGSSTPAEKPADAGVAAITPETDAEKAALVAAAMPVGRKWAAGNPNGTAEAPGDPFLVGYDVMLYDGATQYQVTVIDGAAVPFFGKTGTKYVKSAKDDYNKPLPAATKRQKDALSAAQAYIKDVAPAAQPGGVADYLVYFPTEPGPSGYIYPSVAILANRVDSASAYAMGGTQNR